LATLLNSDPTLDLHVVEAVKLHMLQRAMELHRGNSSGSDVPLFAILMFARDTSETPKDLMNNHLREVGNSGGLEQVTCCFFLPVIVNSSVSFHVGIEVYHGYLFTFSSHI
jgi:hypothetical protein